MLKNGTVEELKATVSRGKGFAQSNLYYVMLPRIDDNNDTYEHGIMCSSVTLPSKQLATVERIIGTDRQDVVHGYVHPNVSMTFRVMNNQSVRDYFQNWQDLALPDFDPDLEGRYQANYPDQYCKTIQIFQLKKGVSFPVANTGIDGRFVNAEIDLDISTRLQSTYRWQLNRAFPVSVQNETLGDENQNEISQFTVEFSYHNWKGESLNVNDTRNNSIAAIVGILAANF